MSMADVLFEALTNITRTQQEFPDAYNNDEVEVVKLAIHALMAKADCFDPANLDPRSRRVLERLVEHLKPLIPPEGVFIPIADETDPAAVARDEEISERVRARVEADRERERQEQPLPTIEPEPLEPFRRVVIPEVTPAPLSSGAHGPAIQSEETRRIFIPPDPPSAGEPPTR